MLCYCRQGFEPELAGELTERAAQAGIDRLLIGARSEDVEALTEFDEGPLPADWVGELQARGIAVVRDVEREAACAVLRAYGELGGQRY